MSGVPPVVWVSKLLLHWERKKEKGKESEKVGETEWTRAVDKVEKEEKETATVID